MMNHAVKYSNSIPQFSPCNLRSISLFHSTPVLERKRRSHYNYRFNYYAKRMSRIESKRALLRNMSDYAEYLFQSWKDEDDPHSFSSNDDTAWFRRKYWSKGAKVNGFGSNEPQWGKYNNKRKGGFNFCANEEEEEEDDDDDDAETIFRSAFGGGGFYYWSFETSDNFHWRNRSGQTNRTSSWNWRDETDDEVDSPPKSDLTSERLALGLKSYGPIKLEEVKNAYRACALRWHPDRHQGSSKTVAEEKFKHCSAAYKSLCDKLTAQ
ncbi:uncharacterized protein LOC109850560 isoform X2 [Asparagus officinalis]|uniref:uncharacterized protein LOC109850560 isoform X2 n=1 Tax=Asparagus officinalis TaxID=4686 RepID=UPI00098E62ED|nr:uncharacterized protein LOC109850560 isoform X2 [Asparagus officinalis]